MENNANMKMRAKYLAISWMDRCFGRDSVVCICFFAGSILFPCLSLNAAEKAQQLVMLGRLEESVDLTKIVRLKNPWKIALTIVDIKKSCGCMNLIDAPIGEIWGAEKELELKVKINTINRPILRDEIAFTCKAAGIEYYFLVKLNGNVDIKFYLNEKLLDFGMIDWRSSLTQKVELAVKEMQDVLVKTGDETIKVDIVKTSGKNILYLKPKAEKTGYFVGNFTLQAGQLCKSYAATWAVKHPLCNQAGIINGLLECEKEHVFNLSLKSRKSFEIKDVKLVSGLFPLHFSVQNDLANKENVNVVVAYVPKKSGKCSDWIQIRTTLDRPNDIIEVPFSAIFF